MTSISLPYSCTDAPLSGQINFGVSALGVASANVFLDLDASATIGFQLNAAANISTETGTGTDVATRDATGSVNGCVDIEAGLAVDAGAKGSFFGIFNAETKAVLFSQKFDLFKVF
jgi:hypothetical protein